MKNRLNALLLSWFKIKWKECFDGYAVKAYSQEGEDMILRRIFENVGSGFYVDVGAHHPKRFSNTYFFYRKGWSGINIDAMPGSMKLFRTTRPRDINIETAVGYGNRELTFFIFNEPALNTFDVNLARERSNGTYRLIQEKKIFIQPLRKLLAENLPKDTKIKFMSVDVEGLDLEVVRSNDWTLFRPEIVLVETDFTTISEIQNSVLYRFMLEQQYSLFGKTVKTVIFQDMLTS